MPPAKKKIKASKGTAHFAPSQQSFLFQKNPVSASSGESCKYELHHKPGRLNSPFTIQNKDSTADKKRKVCNRPVVYKGTSRTTQYGGKSEQRKRKRKDHKSSMLSSSLRCVVFGKVTSYIQERVESSGSGVCSEKVQITPKNRYCWGSQTGSSAPSGLIIFFWELRVLSAIVIICDFYDIFLHFSRIFMNILCIFFAFLFQILVVEIL